MIDVFGLALYLFMLEGDRIIHTKGLKGRWWILSAIILQTVTKALSYYVERQHEDMDETRDPQNDTDNVKELELELQLEFQTEQVPNTEIDK